MKIKKNDLIQITVGKDSGRQGKVERVFPQEGLILVPGINQYKKHRKPQGENRPGEIITLDRPIAFSKVALVCPRCKQLTRIGYKFVGDDKERICRKCNKPIDVVKATTKKAKI